jgi:hypothetical protein
MESALKTEIGQHIERLVPFDEEQNPLPFCPSAGMMIARVTERLAQAGFGIKLWYDADVDEGNEKFFEICVSFLGAATIAINGIAHIHPDADEVEPTQFKDMLVRELDKRLTEMIDESSLLFEKDDPDEWLRVVLALMTGACQSVVELEELSRPVVGAREWGDEDEDPEIARFFGYDDEHDDDEEEDAEERERIDELRTEIADSLFATAVTAAAAGHWFLQAYLPDEEEEEAEDCDVACDEQGAEEGIEGKEPDWSWLCPADLTKWDSGVRWSYGESSASTSRRNQSRLSIAICDTPNAFARRLPLSPTRAS